MSETKVIDEKDVGTDQQQISRMAIQLTKYPIYQDDDNGDQWRTLLRYRYEINKVFQPFNLSLIVDEEDGYAYLREQDESESTSGFRMTNRHALGFHESLLLVMLRRRLAEANVESTRLLLSKEDLLEMMKPFFIESNNEVKIEKRILTVINNVVDIGCLKKLRGGEVEMFGVRPIIKTMINADKIQEILDSYHEYLGNKTENVDLLTDAEHEEVSGEQELEVD